MSGDWSKNPFEETQKALAPIAQPVKTIAKKLGADDKTANIASAVLDPSSLIRTGSTQPIKDLANTVQGAFNDQKPTYDVQAPAMVAKPAAAPPSGPVTMNMPEALRRTTIASVAAPSAPDFSQSAGAIKYQGGLAADLAAASRGEGPSLASEQLKQANAANLAATYSMMASQRGGPSAAGARVGMQTAADLNAKSAQDAAMARIKEQTDARSQLGQVTSQMRAGDVSEVGLKTQVALDTYKGQLQQAVEQGRISAGEASQQYAVAADREKTNANLAVEHNKRIDDYVRMGMSVDEANRRAAIDIEAIRAKVPMTRSSGEQIISGLSQVAGPATTLMTGNPAAGAGVGAAANALRPPEYTSADAESQPGLAANGYRDTTSYRTQ